MKTRPLLLLLLAALLPATAFCQGVKVKVYDKGNTSIKINDSKDTLAMPQTQAWLQNSGLAFSEDGSELFFRHPTDQYYQVWSVAGKQKTAEIPFNEAGNTQAGRTIMAAFPNIACEKDDHINDRIWISADLQVSFDKKNIFTIYGHGQADKTFNLFMRWSVDRYNFIGYEKFRNKVDLSNIQYQFYFHKGSNRFFIAVTADQVTKDKNNYPFCGVYYFDLNTNTLKVLTENMKCECVSGHGYRYRWYFSGNYLFSYFVQHPNMVFRQFDLSTVTENDLQYSKLTPAQVYSDWNPNGWDVQHIGADAEGYAYLATPVNNHFNIYKFDRVEKTKLETVALILHSANRKNYMHPRYDDETGNVMAISPSGKQFAYININHRSEAGNYASIMLYSLDENDRVYTLNDQTRYKPYIAKNYITNKESEDLELSWKNQNESGKKQRKAMYQSKIDSLTAKIAEANNALTATYQRDQDLAKQGKYADLLTGKTWVGYKSYQTTIRYAGDDGSPARTVTAEFNIQEKMQFVFYGENLHVRAEETLKLPRGRKTTDGDLMLKDKELADNGYSMSDYGPVKYIVSNCEAPVSGLKKPEFTLGNTAFIACYDKTTGEEVINDSRHYKKFTDEYMYFLWACKFNIYTSGPDKKVSILATGKNDVTIGFDYQLTTEQDRYNSIRSALQKQLNDLEQFIETGKW